MSIQPLNTQLLDYIKENLTGTAQQNALGFIQHLTSLGMTAEGSANDGRFVYKDKIVCYMYFGSSKNNPGYPEPWTVWMQNQFEAEPEGFPVNDQIKGITWANVHNCDDNCPYINNGCSSKRIIFGREFDKLCQTPIGFTDPNAEAVECMKKLMEMMKLIIDTN